MHHCYKSLNFTKIRPNLTKNLQQNNKTNSFLALSLDNYYDNNYKCILVTDYEVDTRFSQVFVEFCSPRSHSRPESVGMATVFAAIGHQLLHCTLQSAMRLVVLVLDHLPHVVQCLVLHSQQQWQNSNRANLNCNRQPQRFQQSSKGLNRRT